MKQVALPLHARPAAETPQAPAAPAPRPPRVETPRVVFTAGELVKPKQQWPMDERGRPLPSGRVLQTLPFGKAGQLITVEGDKRGYLSGMFDRVTP